MSENNDDVRSNGRNPMNGIAILSGLLLITLGLMDSGEYLIAGTILFSGGLVSYSVQESFRR